VEEAEELHEGAQHREKHGHAKDEEDEGEEKRESGQPPPAEGVDAALELAGDGGVAASLGQPLLREHQRQHGGEDHHGQGGRRVVAGHAGDEEIVDGGAEDEEAEGQAQHLLHLEGLERDHGAEEVHGQDGGRHDGDGDA